jgi:tetratricopeptide (TPR) repeat protein
MTALRFIVSCLAAAACLSGHAEPLVPTSDSQVIEVLPAAGGDRAQERRLRRDWAADPGDAIRAVALSRRYLEQARVDGDPRRAGLALAALHAWPDPNKAPDEVLLMLATIEQYLHDFDTAANHLERLVKRQPQHAQAWLTLATVRRVQGRYAESDKSCEALAAIGAALFAQACRAENDGLRGDFDGARDTLVRLEHRPRIDVDTRNWLLATLAETEARAGRSTQAEAAYRSALAARHDAYTIMSYADFLMQQERHTDAIELLRDQPRNDAVLLRLAIAGTRAKSPGAARDVREMRERMTLASLRPDARTTHAREQAMFALWVDGAPQRALYMARINVRHQREPLDLLVLAQAARAVGHADAIAEADSLRKDMGLHDQRLDSLL